VQPVSITSLLLRPPPIGEWSIVMSVSVCLSFHDHMFGTTLPIFTKKFLHVTCGHGMVLLWRRSDTLGISGFMDDVIFAHKPRLLDVAAQLRRSSHAALGMAVNGA